MKKIIGAMLLGAMIFGTTSASYIDEYELNIVDVTNGAEIRGITISADAAGYAVASYEDGEYMLMAEFQNLTDPLGDDFYEGWVVRQSPFAFISTGELEKKDGKYVNHYTSSVDYSDYDFYVLTLEPNDGDPAPAGHIVEGDVMMMKMMDDTMMHHDDEMMKDAMMDKPDMMKSEMMEETVSPVQKALRNKIRARLEGVDVSGVDIERVKQRISDYKANLDSDISEKRKAQTYEVLDAILYVIMDLKNMSSDMMMQDSMMMDKK